MTRDRVVLCMRWGALYPPAYVNVLHSAVRRYLAGEFRFVCLTNEPDGLDEGIEAFPIPDLGFDEFHWRHGAWPKLSVFVPDLYGLRGRALFIDLDSAIVGPLDPFFDAVGDLVSIGGGKGWRRGSSNPNPSLASGVFAFDLGSQPQIATRFQQDPVGAYERFQLEQRFIQEHVTAWSTWPTSWVISFKRHLRRPILVDRFLAPRHPGPEVHIVAFHGRPRPIDLIQPTGNWDRFPHWGRGQVKWLADYWTKNGGSI